MVTIVSGGANSNREDIFINKIKTAAENGENVLVIIPDQFSFEYDKRLYNALGAVTFNSIRTAGFNRLAEIISTEYGSSQGENAGDNAKTILMYKAVNMLKKSEVKYYKKSLDKASFISEMNRLVSMLRESGITPEQLRICAENVDSSLALKLFDISAVYENYMEELHKAGLKDSLSAMAESVVIAKENNFFKGVSVFVSSFNDFTYDERKMLELCVSQGRSFTVSLFVDFNEVNSFHNHPFGTVVQTYQQIIDIAKSHNCSIEEIEASESNFKSDEIAYLSRNLFNLNRKKYQGEKDDVKIFSAIDVYEEAEYICSEICRLVKDEGYKYNDIAVISRDVSSCASVFEGIFERYEIPYFIDCENKVTASSIVQYFNALFKTLLTKKYKTENIMKYIKSPLFGMLYYEISDLEDYCIKWNVQGDMWKSDFTAGDNAGETYLKKINSARDTIIAPLEKFKKSAENATAKEMCRALYTLLGDIKISEKTYSVVSRASKSENETQLELARGLKQLWNSVLSAVKSIYDILGDENISLRQFYDLFSLMLSQMSVSNPPQKLDCIRIADAGHSRLDNVKVVFTAEVNEGVFPATVKSEGLITENEKNLLENLPENKRIIISGNAIHSFMEEKLYSVSAFSAPSEKLYVLYSQSDLVGEEKRPSMLVREVKEILDIDEQQICKLPLEFFCTSERTAYYKYLEHSNDRNVQSESLKKFLQEIPVYKNKLDNLYAIKEDGNFKLNKETSEKMFFKENITEVSPSKLDKYFECPFAFFCNYGLKLNKVSPMKMNGSNKGNLIHYVLENVMKKEKYDTPDEMFDKAFLKLTDDELRERIKKEFDIFYNEMLGGDFGKTPTFEFLYSKLIDTAFNIVSFVKSELNQSRFEPVLMEYKINSGKNDDRLVLELEQGKKIVLVGKIDRVDIFTDDDGKKYVRIIDYKTGKNIKLSLSRLYNGLNLQMFVYLSSLLETKNIINPDKLLKQAGIVYFAVGKSPDKSDEFTDDENALEEQAEENRLKAFKPLGSVVGTSEIIDAFGNEKEYSYTPYTEKEISKNSDTIFDDEKFTLLRKYSLNKVKEFGEDLLDGNIPAKPLENVCRYCDYKGICGNAFPDNAVDPDSYEYKALLEDELIKIKEEEAEDE